MKKQIKKMAALTVSLLMVAPLAACSGKEETTTTTTLPTSATTTTEETTAESSIESKESTVKPMDVNKDNPLYDPSNKMAIDPYTGIQDMDPANVGKRSIACTISNDRAAVPCKGISSADIVYEYEKNDHQTRYLFVFPDINKIPVIGSFRSARIVAADLANGTDSLFVHWGLDTVYLPTHIKNFNIDHIDLNGYDAGWQADKDGQITLNGYKYAWRDLNWKKSEKRAQLECAVTNGEQIQRAIDDLGIRKTTKETDMIFKFVPFGKAPMKNSFDCKDITVYFTANNPDARFRYNEEDHMYYKSQYGDKPLTDVHTGEQVRFANVFVLFVNESMRYDQLHLDIHLTSGGQGYYISNGKLVEVQWEKPESTDPIKVYDLEGNELEINAGKSHICVVDIKNRDKTSWA